MNECFPTTPILDEGADDDRETLVGGHDWLADDSDHWYLEVSTKRWLKATMIVCCSGAPSAVANTYHRHENSYSSLSYPTHKIF